MTEIAREDHWATVIGCDMRADLDEIQRAYKRRWRELNMSGISPEEWAKAILRLDEALAEARREKKLHERVAG